MGSRRWSNVTKIIVITIIAILAVMLLVTFRVMITPTIVAFLIAFIFSYPVNWVQSRTGLARGTTVAILYVFLLAIVLISPALLYPRGGALVFSLQEAIEELVINLRTATNGPILAIGNYQLSVDSLLQQAGDILQNVVAVSTSNPIILFRSVTTGVLTALYVSVLTFWILKDLQKFQRLIIEQIPQDYQEEVRNLGRDLGQIWDAFLRGQVLLAIVVGMITWIALSLLGMPNAGGLALLSAFMEFLPTIGPGIAMFIGTSMALFVGSEWPIWGNNLTFAIVVLIFYNIITWFESAYLIPRLVGSRVRLHPAITFVGIISGAIVFGLMGVLLATPVIASTRAIGLYIFRKLFDQEPFEPVGAVQAGIRIPGLIGGRKVDGVIFDLDGTITQLDYSAVDWIANNTSWIGFILSEQRRKRIAYRLMVKSESTVNFIINRLIRYERFNTLERFQPIFDQLRAYPTLAEVSLQPYVATTLNYLQPKYQLALVSTRDRITVDEILEKSHLAADTFHAILTRENVRNLVPNSEAFVAATELMDLEVENVLVVSDSDSFLRSGSATGMAAAGVLCGLSEEKDIQSADIVVETTADLNEWL
jgi:predicted PurR-regulated permease PerM/phosphoglycolate phosphatase-like HAD superfamily hydrolase